MPVKTKATKPLVVKHTFNAPRALVWRALTTKDDIARWFFDFEGFAPKPGTDFGFTVEHKGMTYRHLCQVTEVLPQKKIAYTWRYDGHPGDSLVTFELPGTGRKTKLTLTHTGLETFPQTPQFARKNFKMGWTMLGKSLKDLVENIDREIYVAREFDAPRELCWKAMTNPKHVVNWWGPQGFSTIIEKMDFRVGGIWKHVMHGPDGTNYPNKSVFKEIVKPEKIVFAHAGGKKGGRGAHFVSTWTFDELAKNKTRVSIRMIFPKTEMRDHVVKEYNALEGGKQTLGRMAEYVAKL